MVLIREECISDYQKGDSKGAINIMLESWSLLPYPKITYDESFMIVELIIELCIRNIKEETKG